MINNVTLLGRLTATPELKATPTGVSVTGFALAVDRRYQAKGGERVTDFINCVAWRSTAEFITKYFAKGDPIAITGEIQTRKYTDNDGNNRTAFEVIVNQASFCGSKAGGNSEQTPTDGGSIFEGAQSAFDDMDDLPF